MSEKADKDAFRASLSLADLLITKNAGRVAEMLRRQECYRSAKQIFVDPSQVLKQVRINCLADGKKLIMPAPGLKEGFYALEPYVNPFDKLSFVVTPNGLLQHGVRIEHRHISRLQIDLLITDAVAVDMQGGRIGGGEGFFDLSCAILHELKALSSRRVILAAADNEQIVERVPTEDWDVGIDGIVTPEGIRWTRNEKRDIALFPEALGARKIRKISPLFKIYGRQEAGKEPPS